VDDLPENRQQTIRGLSPGTRLGRYTVVRRIGSGGMAELYLGRLDGPDGFLKPVALKLMHPHLSDDRHFARMFLKEARIAAALEHPAIVQVLDVGEFGGEYFMALEYVHGKDLRRFLADLRGTPMALGAALRVVLEVGRALHYAHHLRDSGGRALAIVHRDVSPSNVLVSYQGVAKLADFGVAKVTEQQTATVSGSLKGKLGYMSPEQCLQEHVDARSDVFSLGVVLYEATTGRRAFRADQPVTVMNKVIDGQWVPPVKFVPDYPPKLHEILARALEVDVEKRWPSAEALCEALERFASEAGIDTRPEVLAACLVARYGEPALPDLEVPTLEMPRLRTIVPDPVTGTGTHDDGPARPLPRRASTAAVLVAMLAVGGLLGWQAARNTGEEARAAAPEDAAAPAAEVSPAPAQAAPGPSEVPAVADAAPVPSSDDEAAPADGAEPADEEVELEPPNEAVGEAASEAESASKSQSKRRKRRKPSEKTETDRARDILFPKKTAPR
jgi:tRNA A-37 threonylcarbamoyl transferase component Bud32